MAELENVKQAVQDIPSLSKKPSHEGKTTKAVENVTSKAPSMLWLGLAIGSMALSAGIEIFSKKKEYGNFVGLWAPSFLLIGIYNKLVKEEARPSET